MAAHLLGTFADQPRVGTIEGLDPETYLVRQRDGFVDCRGRGMLEIDDDTTWGHEVRIITQTHNPLPGQRGDVQDRPVRVRKGAFIGAFALLYNCEIGAGAIVACGTVVRSMVVPPGVMVEGNPARIIKRLDAAAGCWVTLRNPQTWNRIGKFWT